MMDTIRSFTLWIVGLAMGVALVVFGIDNHQSVKLTFWLWETQDLPLWSVAILGFLSGIMVAFVVGVRSILRNRRAVRQWRKQAERLEEELTSLRNLPLTEPTIMETERLAPETDEEPASASPESV